MFKHANTLHPGDKVNVTDQTTGKTASAPGEVVEYDPTAELFKVAFSDADAEWLPLESLAKVP